RETKALFEAIDLASPGAVPPEDPSRTRLPREAARLAERALRLADKAGENRRSKLHRIRGELFPRGKPQERVISFLHAVARFGPEAPEAIAGEIRAGEGWPEVFVVERGGAPA
ncbi:MAG: bacillithiol biosynthesis BshC, partial [Candidatus Latescibacterota bacterium]